MNKNQTVPTAVARRHERRARRYRKQLINLRDRLDRIADEIDAILNLDERTSND